MFTDIDKSGLAVGLKQTKKAVAKGVKKVFLAEDAPSAVIEEITEAAGDKLVYVSSMKELGALCGIDVKATCAALRL